MSNLLRSAVVLAALSPVAANATPIEISQMVTLTQEIYVTSPTVPFADVANYEADVWDVSQIPATPTTDPIVSTGSAWVSVALETNDLDTSGLVGANEDIIGTADLGFWAQLINASGTSYEYTASPINVYAGDNFYTDALGTKDMIAFSFIEEYEPVSGSEAWGVFFFAFDAGYFETLTGEINFAAAQVSGIDFSGINYDSTGTTLYDEFVWGYTTDRPNVEAYDGILGDGTLPAVPLPAGLPLMLGAFGAFAALRRRK